MVDDEAVAALAADVPDGLLWADELLTRYGRWAVQRGRGGRTCGSAEGAYRSPVRDDNDVRRTPAMQGMSAVEAMAAQRALIRVADRERVALHVLYVPNRIPINTQLRLLNLTPRDVRNRHATGLLMFANLYRVAEGRR